MSPADTSFPERFATLDLYVMGCVCEDGCCRPIVQKVHGRVYDGGDAYIAWHLPSDPMRGGHYVNADIAAGKDFLSIWQGWAEATE